MKAARFLLLALIFIMSLPHPEAALGTDLVKIHGHVYDTEGGPLQGVTIAVSSLAPPWVSYGWASTNAKGYYLLSLDSPKRLDVPARSTGGRPVYQGYQIWVDAVNKGWMPTYLVVNTENRNIIEQDFILKPAGAVELRAYRPNGTLIETFTTDRFLEDPAAPVYLTDFYWRVIQSHFIGDRGIIVAPLDTPNVINFPWNVPGFGKVILRADNGGEGFRFKRRGETITINLNYELARTEYRLLKESYERYLAERYTFSKDIPSNIQIARELLEKASLMTSDTRKAHFADLCLNQTLWTSEDLELERAREDIEKYRKGNATLRIIDENNQPIEGADISISQVTHDFLFGTELSEVFEEIGMNYGLIVVFPKQTEPFLGDWRWESLPSGSDLTRFRKKAFRLGGEGLIVLEPTPETWTTGVLDLSFDELKDWIYEHVYKIVSTYADYIDYWTVIVNPHYGSDYMGFDQEQVLELYRIGVKVVRMVDPTAQILIFVDHICGWTVGPVPYDDKYSVDPYTYLSRLDEYGIDHDGIALGLVYGSVDEFPKGFWFDISKIPLGKTDITPFPFRDLASISRLLDWYATLNEPIHITYFHAPGNFTSNLGYWHRRSWDEKLQAEWIEKFYTIAFSKLLMTDITYMNAIELEYYTTAKGLINSNLVPRESFYTLKRLITEKWTTRLQMKTDANGQIEFRGFAGDYNIIIRDKDFVKNFTVHVFEGESNAYQIRFDRNELLKKMKADAQSVLQELDRIRQWLETVNKVKSDEMLNTINKLTRLYKEGQYDQVIELGRILTENPLEIQLNGRLSDLEGFTVLRDQENDVALGSPPGTDIKEAYALADSSNLYIGIRVYGDRPNENATFHVEIETDSGRFHVFVRRVDTTHQCGCIEMPEVEGNIRFECAYAIGEIVEMQVPLLKLKSPMTIHVTNAWIWQESPLQTFDSYEGPPVEIPNLRSFKPATTLEIEKTETTYTTAITISPLIETSLPYIAAVSTVIILSVVVYWRKRKVHPSGKKTP